MEHPAHLPAAPGVFAGRDGEAAEILSAGAGSVHTIAGPPGVGKPNPEN